jgi:hypothetical protein
MHSPSIVRARLTNGRSALKPEEPIGTRIPSTDLAAIAYDKCCGGGALEELEEIAVQHHGGLP